MFHQRRLSGILLPLFSLRREGDFGIGDFGSAVGFLAWMKAAKQRLWMVLPLLPTAPNDPSPYSTQSAFGLNPLLIDVTQIPEFEELGGSKCLSKESQEHLALVQDSPRIRYDWVLPLKGEALRKAFERFESVHFSKRTSRARELETYRNAEADWLKDYALFAAISRERNLQGWWEWPTALRERQPDALKQTEERLAKEIRFHAWMQWIAETQWKRVRAAAKEAEVYLCGDEPFIIGQDSVDCWVAPQLLRRDARLGVPPDAFSETGQDWGLPYFDFAAMERDGYQWLLKRANKTATYFDLRRIDHAVGYFRQWIRDSQNPTGRFVPPDEPSQRALGERIFRLLKDQGVGVVAEDLGVIPNFVREILFQIGIPGYRVLRWERDNSVYRDPRQFPASSLVTTGTHDTDTLAESWESATWQEREAMQRVYPELAALTPLSSSFTPEVHQVLLTVAERSGSDLCVLPWQDVLGTRDRVNLPGSMGEMNWTYRIEHSVNELLKHPDTRGAAERLAQLTLETKRA